MMRTVRRSRRLSAHTLLDSLDQFAPGSFDYLNIGYPEPLAGHPTTSTVPRDSSLSLQEIESLSAFADQSELPPPDLHSQFRKRKGKNGNPPRPPNAFMLFRSDFWRINKGSVEERDHRQISRMAATCWNALSEPRRVPYKIQANKLKEEHARIYPQHKYNSSTKDRARKAKEFDNDELCDILAAQVAEDVRASKSQKITGSVESGLFDRVMERKANLKRSRSTSAAKGAFGGESQHSKPPAKKRKKNTHTPPTDSVPVFDALVLPSSHNSPAVKKESPQNTVLEIAVDIVSVKNEPTLSAPRELEPLKEEVPKFDISEMFATSPPLFSPIAYDPPVQYLPDAETAIDKGLQFFSDYGMARIVDAFDFNDFGDLCGASADMGMYTGCDEFAQWCVGGPC